MIHEDGTMDVRIDGKIVRRRYSIDRNAPFSNTYITRMQTKYKPELRDGEEAIFTLSDDVPTIVSRLVDHEREPDLIFTSSEF